MKKNSINCKKDISAIEMKRYVLIAIEIIPIIILHRSIPIKESRTEPCPKSWSRSLEAKIRKLLTNEH